MRATLIGLAALLLTACGQAVSDPVFHADNNPSSLSEWNVVIASDRQLNVADSAITYDLNTPLFSDYAQKLRTVWMPEGVSAEYKENEVFDFPVGTIISKTFYYPKDKDGNVLKTRTVHSHNKTLDLDKVQLIETRLLVLRDSVKGGEWKPISYVWKAGQTDAKLTRIGDLKPLTLAGHGDFTYVVPTVNQCASCHAINGKTREIMPIGPKARHLNRSKNWSEAPINQLDYWRDIGFLSPQASAAPLAVPANANWQNPRASLDARARAYLDINCSHCHSDVGPADTSGLDLRPSVAMGPKYGLCKLPIAAGTGTGDRRMDIIPGDPDGSILLYRMETDNPAAMMPEIGRTLVHPEGAALIRDWIADMDGDCG